MFMGRSKYSNKRIEIDGKKFDSKKEYYRYLELDLLRKAGIIKDLELQPRYPLVINGIKVSTYIADFRYIDVQSGEKIVEDTKGFKTVVYKLKKKLMLALHDITIQET